MYTKCVETTDIYTFKLSNRTYTFAHNNLIEQSSQSKGWMTEGLLYDAG